MIENYQGWTNNHEMDLTKITSEEFKRITKLLRQKETLQAQVDAIDDALAQLQRSVAPSRQRSRLGKSGEKNDRIRPRRKCKELIIAELQAAGQEGMTVKDLAVKLDMKPANMHAWFQGTGKKIPEIKKVGPGKYSWQA